MISIYLGNVGSGKTSSAVKHIVDNIDRIETYTNIGFKDLKGVHLLKPEYIVKKNLTRQIKRKSGRIDNEYSFNLNIDYWKNQKNRYNVVIDEFHNIANARTSMSKKNQIFNRWLTMIRRVLGSNTGEEGELIIISQLCNQIDIIARELTHQVRYHVMHFKKVCSKCKSIYMESSESSEPMLRCRCGNYNLKKKDFKIEVWKFTNMRMFEAWYHQRLMTYYRHYFINDIEKYFKFYNTFQWDNLFEDY